MSITIVLADDHPIVRQGLRALLEKEPDFAVVGEAADGLEAVRLVERVHPDVIVLDLMMPGLGGLAALPILRQRSPETRVVVLSMYSAADMVRQSFANGATGYILKGSPPARVLEAVRTAAAGRRFLCPGLEKALSQSAGHRWAETAQFATVAAMKCEAGDPVSAIAGYRVAGQTLFHPVADPIPE